MRISIRLFSAPILPLALLAACGTPKSGDSEPQRDDTDSPAADGDADGYDADVDCNDADPDVHPGAADPCDGVDNDCDAALDEDAPAVYTDADGDSYGDPATPLSCDAAGVTNDRDCDDTDPAAFPSTDEICNGKDDDCDGEADEDLPVVTSYADADGDGSGYPAVQMSGCAIPAGYVDNDWDCDDADTRAPVWVQTTGRSGARGNSADPFNTIQEAVNTGKRCVRVGPGTYSESVSYNGYNTEVRSTDGADATTITSPRSSAVVFQYGETADAVLDGFTLRGSAGYYSSSGGSYTSGGIYYYYQYDYYNGGGIYVSNASPTLRNLVVTDNYVPVATGSSYDYGTEVYTYYQYGTGGGLHVATGAPTLTDVTFRSNTAYMGGAVYLGYTAALTGTRVTFEGNNGSLGGAVYAGQQSTLQLTNVLANANVGSYGYGTFYLGYYSTVSIDHATMVNNDIAVYLDYGVYFTLSDSILVGNDYGVYSVNTPSNSGGIWALSYNNVYSNMGANYYNVDDPTGVDGNLRTGPRFVSWMDDGYYTNDDLHLSASSECVDAGSPDELDADGSLNDMGGYGGPAGSW